MLSLSPLRFLALLLSVSSEVLVSGQFVKPPKDLKKVTGYDGVNIRYKQVPTGICEQNPKVKSFSGYADVGKNQHLFFWFFEARKVDPKNAPLTLWINGGPGSSSMIGLFQELGPCTVNSTGDVNNNPYSWSEYSNMIFIDQPTQTGFSYSEAVPVWVDPDTGDIVQLPKNEVPSWGKKADVGTYSKYDITATVNSTLNAAPYFYKALQGFMGAFPQYARKNFYFTTESYGGHYAPVFSEYIEEQNKKIARSSGGGGGGYGYGYGYGSGYGYNGPREIHLEGVLIGNGWFDPLLQYAGYYNFTVFPGNTYDITIKKSLQERFYNAMYGPGNCHDQITQCYQTGRNDVCSAADNFCFDQVENIYDIALGRDEYDSRELDPDPFPPTFYVKYLNTEKVQKAIGAYVNFTEGSNSVGKAFDTTGDDGRKFSIIQDMRKLIAAGLTVIMYFGDADYNCNWIGGYAVAEEINPPGFSSAGFVNITTKDGIVHGQVKQTGRFSFVRIYQSGHEVPFYQPSASLTMLRRALKGVDIATGKIKVGPGSKYKTTGPARSTFHNGGGTVQHKVIPVDAVYNTTTNQPDIPKGSSRKMLVKRKVRKGRSFNGFTR